MLQLTSHKDAVSHRRPGKEVFCLITLFECCSLNYFCRENENGTELLLYFFLFFLLFYYFNKVFSLTPQLTYSVTLVAVVSLGGLRSVWRP